MLRLFTSSLLAFVLAWPVCAQVDRETMVHESVIAAPIAEVWRAFTTEEGIKGYSSPHALVDFRMGGSIQTHYGEEASIGEPGTIRHTILALEPGRMFAARVDFPFDETISEFQQQAMETWGVVTLEPISLGVTRIRLASCNLGTGAEWDTYRQFFDTGNAYVLGKLKEYLEAPDIAAQGDEVMGLLATTVGGEWSSSQTLASGETFTTRSRTEFGADGRSLFSNGWLGDGETEEWHSSITIWQDPETGLVWFADINQGGDRARGTITFDGESTLLWDWQAVAAVDGSRARYVVRQEYVDEDKYVQRIYTLGDDGTETMFVETTNRRAGIVQEDE